MAFNVYTTHQYVALLEGVKPLKTFLRDAVFPTAGVFNTPKVMFDIRSGKDGMAPFVIKKGDSITIDRDGYTTKEFMPPIISTQMVISADDLEVRNYGEALFSGMSPDERAAQLLLRDYDKMDRYITAREEWMCAQLMLNNEVVCKAYGSNLTDYETQVLKFHDGDNQAVYTADANWGTSSAKILDDLRAAIVQLRSNGNAANLFICSPSVAAAIIKDAELRDLLDNRRVDIGEIAPALNAQGAAILGRLNVYGTLIDVVCYDGTYTGDGQTDALYITEGHGVLTSYGAGARYYGGITQKEKGVLVTRVGERVPRVYENPDVDFNVQRLATAVLVAPKSVDPWINMTVIS